jgi:hypothetical protein
MFDQLPRSRDGREGYGGGRSENRDGQSPHAERHSQNLADQAGHSRLVSSGLDGKTLAAERRRYLVAIPASIGEVGPPIVIVDAYDQGI